MIRRFSFLCFKSPLETGGLEEFDVGMYLQVAAMPITSDLKSFCPNRFLTGVVVAAAVGDAIVVVAGTLTILNPLVALN